MGEEILDTEQLNSYVKTISRVFFQIPIIDEKMDFRIEDIKSFLQETRLIEKDIFVYCPELIEHRKFSDWEKAIEYVYTMHINTLPYTRVLIGVDSGDKERIENALNEIKLAHDVISSL